MMILLNGLILLLFCIGFYCTRTVKIDFASSSKWFLPFYKVAATCLTFLKKDRQNRRYSIYRVFLKTEIEMNLKALHPFEKKKILLEEYYCRKIALVFGCLFVANMLSGLVYISAQTSMAIAEGHLLKRPAYGAGISEQPLLVEIDGFLKGTLIRVPVEERKYTEEEANTQLANADEQLDKLILGKNESLMHVQSDLNLVEKIPDRICTVEWTMDYYNIIAPDGTINTDKVSVEGTPVTLIATLYCQSYSRIREIKVCVYPQTLSKEQKAVQALLDEIANENSNHATEEKLALPTDYAGKRVKWQEEKKNTAQLLLLAGIVVAIALYIGKDRDLEKLVDQRESQLLLDYPDIISKLTLLLGAGMTVKAAWTKMVYDYQQKKKKDKNLHRYAYEEMMITYYELQSGVFEVRAYENFGKRCRNPRYLKLAALLSQNIKKGSKGLSQMLGAEMNDAFEDRKASAKKLGEEAGTKLMLPMFMMLGVVMVIIVIPAFLSFKL